MLHSFVINSYVIHRDLLSFPTRRSSDLRAGEIDDEQIAPAVVVHVLGEAAEGVAVAVGIDLRGFFGELVHRSEEHTSELQSHVNLVCRLLLEKKKYT